MYRKAKNAHNVAQKVLIDSFGDDFQQHVKKRILTDANNNELKDGRFFIDELCKIKKNGHNLTYEEIAENIKTIIIAVSLMFSLSDETKMVNEWLIL